MGNSAIVVGGGIAGLSAGIALRKAGYIVTLFEQTPSLEPIGAAISIWGNAMAGLDWLGCGDAVRERAHPLSSVSLTGRDERVLWGPAEIADSDSWLPMRTDLQAALLARFGAAHCRLGVRIDDLVETGSGVTAYAAGQPIAEADLAVVADGIRSSTATALLDNPPSFRSYVGALGVGNANLTGPTGVSEEIWGESDRFGLFDASGGRRYWFYMCRAVDPGEAFALDHAAVTERAAPYPERVGQAVEATEPGSLIPLSVSARSTPKRLGKGRVICLGDAAHAMEPNQGQGGCQGIEDAWALGVLAGHLPPERILPELERVRLPRIRRAMFDSALVGRAAHAPSRLVRSALRMVLRLPPRAIARQQFLGRIALPDYE